MLRNSKPNSQKQKPDSQISRKQKRKEDALELAQLVYDMYLADQTEHASSAKIESKEEYKNA